MIWDWAVKLLTVESVAHAKSSDVFQQIAIGDREGVSA